MRATVWGVTAVFAAMAVSGCADLSGAVDDLGHNGYDKQTCADFKNLAMDVQYAAVPRAAGLERARALVQESAKASDLVIRQGVQDYAAAYANNDKNRQTTVTTSLMRVCRF